MSLHVHLDLASLPKELVRILNLLKRTDHDDVHLIDSSEINWEHFVQLAIHHRVYPSIYLQLKKMNSTQVPQEVLNYLQRMYQQNTFQMLQLTREMEQVCRLFSERNVPCLVLKGPVVSAELYGDLSLRTSRDLDILVHDDDLDDVEETLLREGYIKEDADTLLNERKWRKHHVTFIHPQRGITLEIHWRLHPFPFREPSFSQLWKRRRRTPITSHPVYFLGHEDLLLFLIGHGAREGWFRLRWLLDIDYIIRKEMNEEQLIQLIRKYQYQPMVGQALILASMLFDTSVPYGLQKLTKDTRAQRQAEGALFFIQHIVELHSPGKSKEIEKKYAQYLLSLKSNTQILLFTLSLLYPSSNDLETLKLPKYLHFLYFPLRPFLFLWRKSRNVSVGGFR